jgi:hypothetical protein
MPAGRPTDFTRELGLEICSRMCDGESLKSICTDEDMPARSTVHRWLLEKRDKEFQDNYEQAYRIRTDNMFDELEEIADDGTNDYMMRTNKDGTEYEVVNNEHIQRSRLRCDVRKWKLAKMHPEKYSERVKQEVDIKGDAFEQFLNTIAKGCKCE